MEFKAELTQLKRWVEHYSKHYAEDIPEHPALESVLPIFDTFVEGDEDPTEEELSEAITSLSNGKTSGEDSIPADIFEEKLGCLSAEAACIIAAMLATT